MYYVLDENKMPRPEPDVLRWAQWFESTQERVLEQTEVAQGIRVSTVFLGLDRSFGSGPPVLWETLVIGGPLDGECTRYRALEDARRGHAEAVARAKPKFTPGPWRFYDERYPGGRAVLPPSGPAVVPNAWEITDNNAHLIAAAPDLYAALENLLACPPVVDSYTVTTGLLGEPDSFPKLVDAARAALAKARGEEAADG